MLPDHYKIDEKNTVEEPLLEQLEKLGWEVKRLKLQAEGVQYPEESERSNFDEVVIKARLSKSLKKINPFLQGDQLEEVMRRITTFNKTSLLENNKQVLELLLQNTSVSENRETGAKNPTVRYIDFQDQKNNDFLAISQYKVRVSGTENHIFPDIVLFLNGIPVAVIEAKSPKVKDPIRDAISDLLAYSQQSDEWKKWNQELFYYNQILVATCRTKAKFGTITTHSEKHFYRWTDPYPLTVKDIAESDGSPNDQQRLVAGMFSKKNLLDILKTFVIFQSDSDGTKEIKVVWRYQQFRAIKLIVERLKNGRTQKEKWGIVWHTQGSGKSLTMMFLVREMKQDEELRKYKTIFVTDRTQLEGQLSGTSSAIGFSVKVADSISKLKTILPSDSADLVMAMIHKFQERDELKDGILDELNTSDKILVLTDEAHRTQYSLLKANLDKALPNAVHIGFTGTPIEKTEHTFWDYIDKYTMRQAIDDGVTLEIVYEWRTHDAEITDKEWMNAKFKDVFKDYTPKEQLEILWYATKEAYLEAIETIKAKAYDMVEHYTSFIFPNGFKAQVVANSRAGAVRYKTYLEEAINVKIEELKEYNPFHINISGLEKLKIGVVISWAKNDKADIQKYTNESDHENIIKSFKLWFWNSEKGVSGEYGIVIVNNMLLTGFDAPIEQVMYLDRVIVAHNLLQTIARVNRVWKDSKDKGFIVDYVWVGHHLKKALENYDEREVKEITDCLWNDTQELNNLIEAIKKLHEIANKNGIEDIMDIDSIYDLFYDENIRFEYIEAYKNLTKAFNIVLPRKEALEYIKDYNQFTEIFVMAGQHFNDSRMSMKWIPAKLTAITDEYLKSKGVFQKIQPVSILDSDFHKRKTDDHTSVKSKATGVEYAIRHFIEENMEEDPELYKSFTEILEQILEANKDNWEEIYKQLKDLMKDIQDANENAKTYWLHKKKQLPFFRVISKELYGKIDDFDEEQIGILVGLTQEITNIVETELRLSGFWDKPASRNRLLGEIQEVLLWKKYIEIPNMFEKKDAIKARLMEIAQANNDIILYAP
jgi:type I restriction enzyme R subunit